MVLKGEQIFKLTEMVLIQAPFSIDGPLKYNFVKGTRNSTFVLANLVIISNINLSHTFISRILFHYILIVFTLELLPQCIVTIGKMCYTCIIMMIITQAWPSKKAQLVYLPSCLGTFYYF